MILGIEIGGTKLQFGVGDGAAPEFVEFVRRDIDRHAGAQGIRALIAETGAQLVQRHQIRTVGYGFGGPVDRNRGTVITSHQVEGWDAFPLADWTCSQLGVGEVVLGNDCDVATLAEATFGAGRGRRTVYYVTVGTGIGGGLVIDGRLHGADRPAVAEIGHLRPGLECRSAEETVESIASGPGIEAAARLLVEQNAEGSVELQELAAGEAGRLSSVHIGEAAGRQNPLALQVMRRAVDTLGWAIAQVSTIVAPDIVIVGGGVSLMPRDVFLEPLRIAAAQYVFGPLRSEICIEPPALAEEVVVHGAIVNAAGRVP